MKKSTLFLSALLLGSAAFTAQAQVEEPNVAYLVGSFNDYQVGEADWGLEWIEDGSFYRGTFNIPAAEEVSFYMNLYGMNIVPAVFDSKEEDYVTQQVVVNFDNGFYSGSLGTSGVVKDEYWVIDDWKGGELEITLDPNNNEILLSANETVVPEPGVDLYILGNFNGYESDENWKLEVTDDENTYKGTFPIAAGEVVEFYIDYQNISLVPGEIVDGEVIAAESNLVVLADDDFYAGPFATTGSTELRWVINNWKGGNLEVAVDFYNQEIVLSAAEEQPEVSSPYYLSGNFNDNDPAGLDVWNLTATGAEGVYRGTFNLAAGDVEFQVVSMLGQVIVPGEVDENGEISPVESNVNVALEDGFYSGELAVTVLNPSKWVLTGWQGGDLEITLDLNEGSIVLSAASEDVPGVEPSPYYLSGNFNDNDPAGLEVWNFGMTDQEGMYRGTFDLAAGDVEFQIVSMRGQVIVPGEEDPNGEISPVEGNVNVVLDDGFYRGELAVSSMNPSKWVLTGWQGGALEITIDLEEGSIVLSTVSEDVPGVEPSPYYLSGNFNDNDPAGLEVWNFGVTDEEGTYRGTFNIPAGNIEFQVESMKGQVIVPGEEDPNGEISPVESNVNVVLEDGFYAGELAVTSMNPNMWVIEGWQGGDLEITLDLNAGSIVLSVVEGDEPQPAVAEISILGSFNNYDAVDEIWSLAKTDDGVYSGTFDIEAAKEITFYFNRAGRMAIVPGELDSNEMVSPSESNVVVEFDDDFYSGYLASTEVGNSMWIIKNWEGGSIEFTLDLNNETITISTADENPEVTYEVYIAGNFNDYAPEGIEIWSLNLNEAGTAFEGQFPITDGVAVQEGLSFYILYHTIAIVPGVVVDGEVTAASEDVEIFSNGTNYEGILATSGDANVYWVDSDWKGGVLSVSVNLGTGEVSFSKTEETGAVESISKFEGVEGAIYNLQGVKVDANKLNKGIYIINGKKVYVK